MTVMCVESSLPMVCPMADDNMKTAERAPVRRKYTRLRRPRKPEWVQCPKCRHVILLSNRPAPRSGDKSDEETRHDIDESMRRSMDGRRR